MPKIFSAMLANRETRLIAADSWESAIHAVGNSLVSAALVGNLDLDAEDLATDEGETLQ